MSFVLSFSKGSPSSCISTPTLDAHSVILFVTDLKYDRNHSAHSRETRSAPRRRKEMNMFSEVVGSEQAVFILLTTKLRR